MNIRPRSNASRLLAGSGLAAIAITMSAPLAAQEGSVINDGAQEEQEEVVVVDNDPVVETENEPILVTGSRIRRSEASSAAPLQIIDPDLARRTGATDTAEIVQNSPIASGSSQITAAISANAVANGGQGAETISLRGLGAERTLVLLNSRRAGPAGTRGAVSSFDLNVLPSSIIDRVEILKDGASSIYGSDAVAGVVNLLTKRSTDGLEIDGSVTLPFESGGEIYQGSAAWGKEFDRGHIMFAGEFYRQNELERQDRDYLDCDYDYLFSEDGERIDLIDPRTGEYACNGTTWGHVWAYYPENVPRTNSPSVLMQFSYGNDDLGRFVPAPGPVEGTFDISAPDGWFPVAFYDPLAQGVTNSYHPFEQKSSVIPETERYTGYLEGSYALTDTIEAYVEGLFNRRRTYVDSYSQFYNFGLSGVYYDEGDPDDPFPGWNDNIQLLSPTGILDNYDNEIEVDYYRGVLGFRGDLTDRFGFDVHGQYSRSDGDYTIDQILQDVITQQTDRAFGYGCAGQVTPISNRECLQLNWVDPRVMAGDLTAEEEAYLTGTETGNTLYTQAFIEGSVAGELFELPTGWLGFAAGAVYRRDTINDLPGSITYAPNPDYDPAAAAANPDYDVREFIDNAFANPFSSGNTVGRRDTAEAFVELEAPLIRDRLLVQDLTISASARVTNVTSVRESDGFEDTDNGNITYKFMGNWQVTDFLRFRGTYGTSYRAPALFELFLADQVSGVRQTVDPCVNWGDALENGAITQRIADNCASEGLAPNRTGAGIQASVFTSGGVGRLESETSRAITASVILTPDIGADSDLALTVDYFDIKVKDEIAQLTASAILRNCYDSPDFPNSEFCELFERGQDGDPTNIRNIFREFINVDEQSNRGIDFTLRAGHDFGNAGRVQLVAQATYQLEDTINRLGEFEDFNGEVGDPKFTADINLVYDYEGWSLLYGMDIIGASSSEEDFLEDNGGDLCRRDNEFAELVYQQPYCFRPYTDAVFYHNLSLSKEFADRFEVTAGVSNLLDTRPPQVSGVATIGGASPFVSQYDWLGRRVFLRAGVNF